MNQTNFLRLAFILSDGQAITFKKNLLKLVLLILFENYGQALTISEIIIKITETYSLDFADSEIKTSIRAADTGSIVEMKNSKDPVYFTYSLSPNEYAKLQGKIIGNVLSPLIDQFLEEAKNGDFLTCPELESVVCRFLYQEFNSDIQTVLALMNYHGEAKRWNLDEKGFSDREILSLNAFLNWPNAEKNKLIFKYVSFCYEYCVMTVKKDKSIFASIFKGKEFYLDANILFRLAGFNKLERKTAVSAFLQKCRECGVQICYTNFTSIEIENTLAHHVDIIKKLLGGTAPISVNAMEQLSSRYANLDFYAQYVEWSKHPQNKIGDYASFLADLKKQVARCTADMKFKVFETSNQLKTKELFAEYSRDLAEFKAKRNKGAFGESIKIDIENYLLMSNLTKNNRSTNFFDEKHFFITADHIYIEWACEKTPGAIPLFILPSVWYSIMLKYHGRTDDDYSSFCQFLNKRISEPYDDIQEQKMQMLACVLDMDESVEIKEQIIFDIGQRLSTATNCIEDVEAFVEEVHTRITDTRVAAAVQLVQETHRQENDTMTQSIQEQLENNRVSGFQDGINQGRKAIFHSQAIQKAKRNKWIRILLAVIAGIFVILFVGILIIQYCTGDGVAAPALLFIKDNSLILSIISGGFAGLCICFSEIKKQTSWLSTDVEVLEKRLETNADKQEAQ